MQQPGNFPFDGFDFGDPTRNDAPRLVLRDPWDLTLETGVLTMAETTTPTALADYGKVYTKNDNQLYFQSGDGVEHQIAFV
jgi:hypothetical protein